MRQRGWPVVTAFAVIALVVAAVGCSSGVDEPVATPAEASPLDPSPPISSLSSSEAALRLQSDAVADRDRAGYLAAWDHRVSAQQLAAQMFIGLVRLGVTRIEPRLILGTLTGSGSSWTAEVDLTWWLDGMQTGPSTTALAYTFTDIDGRAVISQISPVSGGREPVWLLPDLVVRRGARTLVVATDPAAARRVDLLLTQAVDTVGSVLPTWHGSLVAYVPKSPRQFAAIIAASPKDYRGIAAVTTTVDGSHDVSAATAIVVNPGVFDRLGPIGAHVVITHEATHVATAAAAVSMPLWVAEGFADYVGIGSVDLPTSVAGKAALNAVRRQGPPDRLPVDAAFAVGSTVLEAAYEQAWLATSLIAETYGRQQLVAFYRWVMAHPDDLDAAFERVLGTSRSAFTEAWRGYLVKLAGDG